MSEEAEEKESKKSKVNKKKTRSKAKGKVIQERG